MRQFLFSVFMIFVASQSATHAANSKLSPPPLKLPPLNLTPDMNSDLTYDLACSIKNPNSGVTVSTQLFHIDLYHRSWCSENESGCQNNPHSLAVEPGKLWLDTSNDNSAESGPAFVMLSVDRITGTFIDSRTGRYPHHYEGVCERRPYMSHETPNF